MAEEYAASNGVYYAPGYHYDMMHDDARNMAYEKAIAQVRHHSEWISENGITRAAFKPGDRGQGRLLRAGDWYRCITHT